VPTDTLNPPPELTSDTFSTLFETCRPKSESERWTQINWNGELWEGRRLAAQHKKPLFIWAMNGHPLGCV
jgi:hypothetical protein